MRAAASNMPNLGGAMPRRSFSWLGVRVRVRARARARVRVRIRIRVRVRP